MNTQRLIEWTKSKLAAHKTDASWENIAKFWMALYVQRERGYKPTDLPEDIIRDRPVFGAERNKPL